MLILLLPNTLPLNELGTSKRPFCAFLARWGVLNYSPFAALHRILRLLEPVGTWLHWRMLPIVVVSLLLCTACAKVGEPLPPEIRIPRPAVDLLARQLADRVVLTVSLPGQNTDGSPVTTLREVEVFRAIESREQMPDPISEDEFLKQAVRILAIPFSQFADYLENDSFVISDMLFPPDPSGIYTNAFRYAVRFINNKNQTAGLSNQVLITPVAIPLPPLQISADITENSIHCSWIPPTENIDGSRPARIAGYNLYRWLESQQPPNTPINAYPLQKPEFVDNSFEFDKTYCYAVSVVGSLENPYAESLRSSILSVTPRDIFPPDPPQNLNAIVLNGVVILLWEPPSARDIAGYRILRREDGMPEKQFLQQDLITNLSYRDQRLSLGKKYIYHLTAVDIYGNESMAVQMEVEIQQE